MTYEDKQSSSFVDLDVGCHLMSAEEKQAQLFQKFASCEVISEEEENLCGTDSHYLSTNRSIDHINLFSLSNSTQRNASRHSDRSHITTCCPDKPRNQFAEGIEDVPTWFSDRMTKERHNDALKSIAVL